MTPARSVPYGFQVKASRESAAGQWAWWRVAGPLLLAIFQTVGTFGAAQGQPDKRPLDAIAIALALAGPVALLWLRRFPIVVLTVVVAVTSTYLLRNYPYGPVLISMVIALITTVVMGHRVAAWSAVAFLLTAHFLFRGPLRDDSWSWGQFAGVAAWALVILIGAEVARVRRERAAAAGQMRAESNRRRANEERLRIARELHDTVAHQMSLINVQAGVALHLFDRQPEQAQTALAAIKKASSEGLAELRSLVGVLRDESQAAPRVPTSMLGSLDDLIERTAATGLAVSKHLSGETRPLPTAVDLAAFRIIQEALTNVVRHSAATRVRVALRYGADDVTVQVDDDGQGGDVHILGDGSGILGMRERASTLGGSLSVGRSPLGGYRVTAALPVQVSP